MKADKEKNDLLKSIYDEMEFNDIKKSIQFHKNQTNEEIESTLLKEKKIIKIMIKIMIMILLNIVY